MIHKFYEASGWGETSGGGKSDLEDHWYKRWCKETYRGGGVLIGSSIKQLLNDHSKKYTAEIEELKAEIQRLKEEIKRLTPDLLNSNPASLENEIKN